MRISLRPLILTAILGIGIYGCAKDDTVTAPAPTTEATSTVQFDYSGDTTGTYKATGKYPSSDQKKGSGVKTTMSADSKTAIIRGISFWPDSLMDLFFLTLTSTSTITDGQKFSPTTSASSASMTFVRHDSTNYASTHSYVVQSLDVTVTSNKDNILKGTFSGTLNKLGKTLTVTNGSFDLKYQ